MGKDELQGFYTYCLTTCSPKRLQKIKGILAYANRVIGKDLNALTVDDVVLFLSKLNQSEFKAWTKNDYKKIFKRFLKWKYQDISMVEGAKVKEGFRGVSQRRAFNRSKINKTTLLKPEELEALLRASKSLKWKALISFAYESAFRPCETRTLRWEQLNFDDSRGICRVSIISPKTKDFREVPVKNCIVHLKRWRDEYAFPNRTPKDFVFPSQHNKEEPMGEGVITHMFKRLSKEAGIRPIFPYLLRHTRIYELQKRLPEKISAKFAGHSIETSELYNSIADDDVEESMLREIYPTKELTIDERTKLERDVADMKKQNTLFQDALKEFVLAFEGKTLPKKQGEGVLNALKLMHKATTGEER